MTYQPKFIHPCADQNCGGMAQIAGTLCYRHKSNKKRPQNTRKPARHYTPKDHPRCKHIGCEVHAQLGEYCCRHDPSKIERRKKQLAEVWQRKKETLAATRPPKAAPKKPPITKDKEARRLDRIDTRELRGFTAKSWRREHMSNNKSVYVGEGEGERSL